MLISDIVKEILETNNLSQEKLAKILKGLDVLGDTNVT